MAQYTYTAYVEHDPETDLFVGVIPAVPGAHTQGATLDELQANLQEVLALCLAEQLRDGEAARGDTFVGLQRVMVTV